MPIFADLRLNFLKTKVTPFLSGAIGYSLKLIGDNNVKGGLLINPAFGVKFIVSSKAALHFSIGYKYEEYSVEQNSYYGYYPYTYEYEKEKIRLINFKFGVTF